jgi:hypothetical protein
MKPFLTPHATLLRPQPTASQSQTPQPASARSTVLLSLLLAPRNARGDGPPRS